MKTVPVAEAIALLESASAVVVDQTFVTFPEVDSAAELDEPFLVVANDDAASFGQTSFLARDNPIVPISGNVLTLVNRCGASYHVAILVPLESELAAS